MESEKGTRIHIEKFGENSAKIKITETTTSENSDTLNKLEEDASMNESGGVTGVIIFGMTAGGTFVLALNEAYNFFQSKDVEEFVNHGTSGILLGLGTFGSIIAFRFFNKERVGGERIRQAIREAKKSPEKTFTKNFPQKNNLFNLIKYKRK